MQEIKNIMLRDIVPNPLNKSRSMDYNEIENLKDSIQAVGLLHPLVVYRNDLQKYTLISGHRRFAALNNMAGSDYEVPCVIIDTPENEIEEAECMARANVHRSSPDEIKNEVKIANSLWDSMDKERRKKCIKRFEQEFVAENEFNPVYKEDPKKFKSNRFRPRLMYIKSITGLGLSNKTISELLKSQLKDAGEGIPDEKKKRESGRVSVKKVLSTMAKLNKQLDSYAYREDTGKPEYIEKLQEDLQDIIERLENITDEDL